MRKPTFLWRSEKPLFHTVPLWARTAGACAAMAYLAACGGLWSMQRDLIYHPPAAPSPAPGSVLARAGEARFWVTPAAASDPGAEASPCAPGPSGRRGAVAYFGGNAEGASRFGAQAARLPGCVLYALDYPGYEGAPGRPTEESIHRAADAMLAAMAADGVDLSRSLLMGRSLGSGVASRQAANGPCALAALITPYESLAAVAGSHVPWAPASLLMLDKFDARPWAAQARCPAAVVFADEDETIPPMHALALARAWNPQRGALVSNADRATHDDVLSRDGPWGLIRRGWRQALANAGS